MHKIRFYNAGDMIQDRFAFTLPDGPDIHASGFAEVKLNPKSFSEIETEYRVGPAVVRLQLDQDVLRRYGKRGVVLVDANLDPKKIGEDEPLALSDSDAEERGARLWLLYLREIVMRHEEENALVRSQGGARRSPGGFTRRAYKLLGLKVPGDEVLQAAAAAAGGAQPSNAKVEALEREMQELRALLAALGSPAPASQPAAPSGGKGRGSQPPLG